MRHLVLLMAVLALGCQSESAKRNGIKSAQYESEMHFKNEHHLFLNYFFGMSISDYEKATKKNFIEHKIFLSGEKEQCELNRYSHKHTELDVENISRHSIIYYQYQIGGEEFEAVLRPVFKYNRLAKIELQTLNCFNFGNHQHAFYRRKVNDTQKALLEHHREKFGAYTVTQPKGKEREEDVIKNAGVNLEHFDTNRYIFTHQNKVVTIEQKCCDFKPLIVYTHKAFFDYTHNKSYEKEMALESELYHYRGESEL